MSVEIACKQNVLVTDFHLLKSLLVVFGLCSQAFTGIQQTLNDQKYWALDPFKLDFGPLGQGNKSSKGLNPV